MTPAPESGRALAAIVRFLIRRPGSAASPRERAAGDDPSGRDPAEAAAERLNAAFLAALAGDDAAAGTLRDALEGERASPAWREAAQFYLDGLGRIRGELDERSAADERLAADLGRAAATLAGEPDEGEAAEAVWSVLFPEGAGIRGLEAARVSELRARRTVTIRSLNPRPIRHPAAEVLFTSNVLLTTPASPASLSGLPAAFGPRVAEAARERQRFWYDHPIPIGSGAESNEILYGLRHLNDAVAVERERHGAGEHPVACVLSVSVTHAGLHGIGRPYLDGVLAAGPPLDHLRIFAFTETDCEELVDRVLAPAAGRGHPGEDAEVLREVFGVDGRYGRHYSFLKAIAALWHVLIDPDVRATFKIDLDQVFPQSELVAETGSSAFGHLRTPLWGATGEDAGGRAVELGMIAGALVNQRDVSRGLFTPDVTFPAGPLAPDEFVFFSRLPQALSTHAEMMTRYAAADVLDARHACLERIHVTGGTNGILVDSLRRFRPFTPGFIGRAEDQAYVLSTLGGTGRLGYLHASGLFMRHDKEGFAQEAMALASAGKEIGDSLRILMFSAYARALGPDVDDVKALADPFTGCFISKLPGTVVLLRLALRAAGLFAGGKSSQAAELLRVGLPQVEEALQFTTGDPSPLHQALERERRGWRLYYDGLAGLERGLRNGEAWAESLRTAARRIVDGCRVRGAA